jgi:hypothetical protein
METILDEELELARSRVAVPLRHFRFGQRVLP